MSTVLKGIVEVQEFVVDYGLYIMSIPGSTQEQVDTINHNLGFAPFFNYTISDINDDFRLPPALSWDSSDVQNNLTMYTDETKVYFHYHHESASPPSTISKYYIMYQLWVAESSK